MDNPLWYIATLIIGASITLVVTLITKKSESKTQAKTTFLDKRIDKIEGLYQIISEAQLISWLPPDKVYYQIFSSHSELDKWRTKLMNYANRNSLYFTKEIKLELIFLNNLLKQIDRQITIEKYNDLDIKLFCNKYYSELQEIFSGISRVIMNYFENKITIDYKINEPTEADFNKCFDRLNNLKLTKENELTQTHIE